MSAPITIPGFVTDPDTGACHCPSGVYGFTRGEDGLIHAFTTAGRQSKLGATDEVARMVVLFFAPLPGDMEEDDDLENEAFQFIATWDSQVPGTAMQMATMATKAGANP